MTDEWVDSESLFFKYYLRKTLTLVGIICNGKL
jgi:hypothetical protein